MSKKIDMLVLTFYVIKYSKKLKKGIKKRKHREKVL